ncbi:hypothetical protein J3F83DRAFT_751844 [Trichoderma novae-zelandiae]
MRRRNPCKRKTMCVMLRLPMAGLGKRAVGIGGFIPCLSTPGLSGDIVCLLLCLSFFFFLLPGAFLLLYPGCRSWQLILCSFCRLVFAGLGSFGLSATCSTCTYAG